ncbi:hypothetical protein RRG08_036003 [Elysia crispata]|uniref:Uncharacterized protein n=1 Tax=Elysia crispata TaxID=231223 RepID=A0AAE1AKT1_9GAST|nr:hypothetical protein RRG08_036003 [Elysia crispata]
MDLLYGHDRKLGYLEEPDMVDFLDPNDIFHSPILMAAGGSHRFHHNRIGQWEEEIGAAKFGLMTTLCVICAVRLCTHFLL